MMKVVRAGMNWCDIRSCGVERDGMIVIGVV